MQRKYIVETIYAKDGEYEVTLIDHPTVDDLVVSELKLALLDIVQGPVDPDRRVTRSFRDYLIRTGVEH